MFRKHFLLLVLVFVFSSCDDKPKSSTQIEELLPANTVWLAEVNDWEELQEKKSQSRVIDILSGLKDISAFYQQLESLKAPQENDSLQELLQDSRLYLATVLAGADRYHWLGIILNENPSAERLFKAYKEAEKIEYAGEELYHLSINEELEFYLHHQNDYYLISRDRITIEAAIRQKASPAQIANFDGLSKIRNSRNSKAPVNLYLNLEQWPNYLASVSDKGYSFPAKMGDWLLLDLESESHDLIATGLLSHPITEAYFPQSLSELRSDQIEAQKLIPINLAYWLHFSVGNAGQYQRAYEAYLEKDDRLKEHQEILNKLPSNAPDLLRGIIDSELGCFQAGRAQNHAYDFAYFNVRDIELAEQSLESLADSNFIEGYRGHVIRRISAMNLLPRVYGSAFEAFHQPYYLIHKDFVILGNELAALKVVLNDILDQKTLDRSDSYLNLSSQLSGKAQVQVLYGIPEWLPNQRTKLRGDLDEELESMQDSLQNLRWAILQLKAGKDRSFISAMLREEKPIEEKIVRQWTVQLEGQPVNTPQFLRNHNNQKLDIALQDEDHKLYLISRKGEVYWQKSLDGPIMGDIRQIDIYRNNKLQMVFNTENKLWVVDRLGRNVEGFPIDLAEKATAPVGVFNYDQARNYRLVVPCGKMLHNYDVEGKKVKGWNFKKAAADIVSEPQFFSVAGKDIIVCLSEDGKLYQLNRRGEERFKVEEKIEELKTSFYLKAGETLQESELVAGSNSGKMYVINPEGKTDAIYLDQSHPADHLIYFEGRYIFSDGPELFVKDDQAPFDASLEDDISVKPKAMILNNRFYVAAFSAKAEEIRLFNQEGDLVDGFPVFAQGPFDMGSLNRDKSLNIVSYSSDGTVICYRLR